jgi:transcriptional regulator with XRE-family HTH domain
VAEISRLGTRLRKLRIRAGWTQHELAERSGVSRTAIASIETGQRSGITLDNAFRLAEALGVSVETLAGWDPLEPDSLLSGAVPHLASRVRHTSK